MMEKKYISTREIRRSQDDNAKFLASVWGIDERHMSLHVHVDKVYQSSIQVDIVSSNSTTW